MTATPAEQAATGASAPAITRSYDQAMIDFADEVGESGPVAVEGGRTRWDLGGELADGTRLVQAPSGIVDYQPAEMTIRVRAGTPVAVLDEELSEAEQRTALPVRSPSATIGGALAVGENHLAVLGRGRVRDALLEVTYVSSEGRLVTGGGPTVKNVSGFNLPRLLVGSLGTLGLMSEVILRTNPRPATSQWVRLTGNEPSSAWAIEVFRQLVRPGAVLHDGTSVWVLLEGHGADVVAQRAQLATRWEAEDVEGPTPLPPHRRSLTPAEAARYASDEAFVASVGVGLVHTITEAVVSAPDPASTTVSLRMKAEFDPTGRLNPGRRA